jgi:hypothetical protein
LIACEIAMNLALQRHFIQPSVFRRFLCERYAR